MTRVEALEKRIEKLSPGEVTKLRDWLLERDWQCWDRQIERDGAAGKLDKLFKRGLKDHPTPNKSTSSNSSV